MPLSSALDLVFEEIAGADEIIDRPDLNQISSEELILGGIISTPSALDRIKGKLKPEAFLMEAHRMIYGACLDLHDQGKAIDLMTLAARLNERGQYKAVGGSPKLSQLLERTLGYSNIEAYAEIVHEGYLRRQLQSFGIDTARGATDTSRPVQELLDDALHNLDQVREQRPAEKPKSGQELAACFFASYEVKISGEPEPRLKTGLKEVDLLLRGGVRETEQLVTILADTGCGKTTFALQSAWNMAIQYPEKPVIFFSLEMGAEELTERLICSLSSIPSDQFSSANFPQIIAAMEKIGSQQNFFIDDTASTVSDIVSVATTIRHEWGGLGAVWIDYLQLIRPEKNTGSKVQDYDLILKELKRLTRKNGLNTSVFTLSQIGRDTTKTRQNKRPGKSDGLWCSSIEQDSNILLGLYNDAKYNPETEDRGIVEISVLKNRSGPEGVAKVLYEPDLFRFCDIRPAHPQFP